MIELRISGETVEKFWETWSQLTAFKPDVVAAVDKEATDVQETQTQSETVVTAGPNPSVSPETPKPKRGRPPKSATPAQTIETTATELNDPIGDLSGGKPAETPKPLTLDDIRERVRLIIDAHTKRGNEMPAVVAYVQHLFKPYGIAKAAELSADKWAEFMVKSKAYLDGTVVVA
jgi:hypothetical protein